MDEKILMALNGALAQEHGCYVRYKTHAAVITGPYTDLISTRLKEIAADDGEHAESCAIALPPGGVPTMDVAKRTHSRQDS